MINTVVSSLMKKLKMPMFVNIMNYQKRRFVLFWLIMMQILWLLVPNPLFAEDITIDGTSTTPITLGNGDNLIINSGATLNSGYNNGVYASSGSATVINNGSIYSADPSLYAIRDTPGVSVDIYNAGTLSAGYAIRLWGTAGVLENSGTIVGRSGYAIRIGGSLGIFTNTGIVGVSSGGSYGVSNGGSVGTVNNLQDTFWWRGTLPLNYNIIINGTNSYGKLNSDGASGALSFGLDISNSTAISPGNYSAVISGITDATMLGASQSTDNSINGTSGSWSWQLIESEVIGVWDLNISPSNNAPSASAGADQSVAAAASVTLDASASADTDPGDSIASYAWTQSSGTAVTLSSTSAAQPTFTAPSLNVGDSALTLVFQVEDDRHAERN